LFKNVEDLLSSIGYGKVSHRKVVGRLSRKGEEELHKEDKGPVQQMFDKAAKERIDSRHTIKIKGVEDLLVRFARCCNPVPGDTVIGFVTRGRGVSVHTRSCPKTYDTDPQRLVDIEWDLTKKNVDHIAKIRVVCEDRTGLLAAMSNVVKNLGVNITRAQISTTKDSKAVCFFSITIKDLRQLRAVISQIEGIDGVISVSRQYRKT